jgi:hypothetical protein
MTERIKTENGRRRKEGRKYRNIRHKKEPFTFWTDLINLSQISIPYNKQPQLFASVCTGKLCECEVFQYN